MQAGPVIAHRGASLGAPENSIAALALAADLGAGWVEIDVQVSSDGGVFLMHDADLDRTTDGQGPLAVKTSKELRRLRTRDLNGILTDHTLPEFREAMDLCTARALGLVLEIKATWGVDAEDACAVAAHVPLKLNIPIVVTSFSVTALTALADLRPDLPLGLACLRPPSDPARASKTLGLSAIHCNDAYVNSGDIMRMREAGLGIAVATVNDPARARALLDCGVHGIITDWPDLLTCR